MKKIASLVAIAALAGSSYAANIDTGTYELILGGGYDGDSALGGEFDLTTGLGYFIADGIEVGGIVEVSDNDVATLGGLGGFGEYNVNLGTEVVPFVGALLSWLHAEVDEGPITDETADAANLEVYGGAKYFITEDLNVFAQLEFDIANEDIYVEDDEITDTNWEISWGLRYLFDR